AKQQGKCMFGGRNGVAARRVEHNNTASRRSFDIDVINTDAGTANHAQLGAGIQDISGNFRLTTDNQRAELRDEIDKFGLAQAGFDCNLERAFTRKLIDAALGDGIGDEDFGRSHGWKRSTFNVQRSTLNPQRSMKVTRK